MCLSAFLSSRKAYKLTPLCPKERLTTTPGLCDSRSIYSKLTGNAARLREVSCWIYLGFEPTTLELSTSSVFTVGEVAVPNYHECLCHRASRRTDGDEEMAGQQ